MGGAAGAALTCVLPLAGGLPSAQGVPAPAGATARYIVVAQGGDVSAVRLPASAQASAQRYPGIGALVAELTAAQAADLDSRAGVSVSRDGRVTTVPVQQAQTGRDKSHVVHRGSSAQGTANSWGLDRIDQRNLPLSGTYTPHLEVDGGGAHVFIIDTGLASGHPEFSGRVGTGIDIVDGDGDPQDCHGHGTHVAGTVGSNRYGVAVESTVHGVRVLDCGGSGSFAGVIAGMNWVVQQRQALGHPVVANMSLAGGFNQAVNDATANMVANGVTTVVAAANAGDDACNWSPASTPEAITVAASDDSDQHAMPWSNFGPCVDLYAPGVDIRSTDAFNPDEGIDFSGTSMASPHVAGWAALYHGLHPDATPEETRQSLLESGTQGKVIGAPPGTPNVLPYTQDMLIPTRVAIKVKNGTALRVNVDPNSVDLDYGVRGQRKQAGNWVTEWTANTQGDAEKLKRNVPRGKWRIVVPAQHEQPRAISATVRVAR
jgi:subtilisin family serine protease